MAWFCKTIPSTCTIVWIEGHKKTKWNKTKKHWKQSNSFTKDSLLILLSYHIWLLIHRNIMSRFKGSIQTHSDCCSHPPTQKAADNSIRTKRNTTKAPCVGQARILLSRAEISSAYPERCRRSVCASRVVCSTMCSVPLAYLYSYPNPNEVVNAPRHRKQNADCSTNGRTHQILPIDVLEAVLNYQLPHAWIRLAFRSLVQL